MGHHVDFPTAPPVLVRGFRTAGYTDSGVGAENVNLAARVGDGIHQIADVLLRSDVAVGETAGRASDFTSDLYAGFSVNIGDDHRLCAGGRKLVAQRTADPVRPTGHDDDFSLNLHD